MFKLLTFNCDLELELEWLKHMVCMQSQYVEYLTKVIMKIVLVYPLTEPDFSPIFYIKQMNRRRHSYNSFSALGWCFMNVEFALRAVMQILNTFDLEL